MEDQQITISRRITGEGSMVEDALFASYNFEVESFAKTHFFSGEETHKVISSDFKEYLYGPFEVTNQLELIRKINGEWRLIVRDGMDPPTLDMADKNVVVFLGNFEEYYAKKRARRNAAKAAKSLYDDDAKISSRQIADIFERISYRSNEIHFTRKEKSIIRKNIPKILLDHNIKLDNVDLFDIEKVSIREVIETGRRLLKFDRRAAKILEVNDVHSEKAWQKYFEKYGKYLLFGSVTLEPQVCLDKDKTRELNNKYPDLITCNRYGFLDIIELKRSEFYIFQFDASHNKLVPTMEVSSAMSQLNAYLQIIPYAYETTQARAMALTCANGMLLIGDRNHLIKKNKAFCNYLEKLNTTYE